MSVNSNDTPSVAAIKSLRDLRQFPQWVCFTAEKQPINPKTGYGARANDPTTWGTDLEAVRAWRSQPDQYAGIGFELTRSVGITVVDLDKCIDAQGQISPYARAIVARLDSYTESSPSGKGLHIWVLGTIPTALAPNADTPDIRIEMYCELRYMTITGRHLKGTPETFEERQEVLLQLHAEEKARRHEAKAAKRSGLTPRRPKVFSVDDSPYALGALADECADLAATTEGGRNDRVNLAAFNMGQFVGGKALSRDTVEQAIFAAAIQTGLPEPEIKSALQSGLEAGILQPRVPPVNELIYGQHREVSNGHNGHHPPSTPGAPRDQREPDSQFVIGCLREGEYGDSLLFALLFRGLVLFDHTSQEWYTWNGHYWEEDGTGKIKHLVSGRLASCYIKTGATLNLQASQQEAQAELSQNEQEQAAAKERVAVIKRVIKELTDRAFSLRQVSRCKNILYFAQSHEGMGIQANQWDHNPWLLAVPNGVLDLHTGTLRDGKPDDYIRTAAPTPWLGLETPAPRWERFLQEIFADRSPALRRELISFFQRLLGYGITGEVIEHIFALFWGEDGRNGKDTIQRTMTKTLGSASGAIHKDVLLDAGRGHAAGAPTPHLSALQGRRLAWANEPDKGARFNVGQIKDLSGGGDIPTRGLHEKKYTLITPSHLLILLSNHKPHADANDTAFWDRLVMITFNMRFVDHPSQPNERLKDTQLWPTLEGEASGILAWLVRGCLQWQAEGLCIPDQVKAAVKNYQAEEDDLRTYLEERCLRKEGLTTKASVLYSDYEKWAQSGNLYVLNKTQFGKLMAKKGIEKVKQRTYIEYKNIGLLTASDNA